MIPSPRGPHPEGTRWGEGKGEGEGASGTLWVRRPAVVLQSDLVSEAGYPSTVVIPTTTQLVENAGLLRLRLKHGVGGIERDSDVLIGQLIGVANESFTREIGVLPDALLRELERRVQIVLEL